MLELKHISKQYVTGSLVQNALDDVSLSFRDHEFVTILGPSGSGKTTLLNIIGGLDRYDSGDLIIDGRSTREYRDRDWDTYRNHTIGFVFQSYNLIPHQTVLSNVELALTISGISHEERKRRAQEALEQVGLGEQSHKKPAQMSGGQMQRVALARALVNNPTILLADEPTGALDSDTSVQVMDLLKEVSKDRLVVMVSHNAELAEQYSTRIVRIRDGHLMDDTNPYSVSSGEDRTMQKVVEDSEHGQENGASQIKMDAGRSVGRKSRKRRASMSVLTAFALSFQNLLSKKARTVLVAFAGSVGIIGIALILALSTGVNRYIGDIEQNSVLQYPLTISQDSINYTTYLNMPASDEEAAKTNKVRQNQIIRQYSSGLNSNDLKAFRTYIQKNQKTFDRYSRSIEYNYNVTPQVYLTMKNGSVRQVSPEQCVSGLNSLGIGSLELSFVNLQSFYQLPEDSLIYRDRYTVKAGHWPRNSFECVLILEKDGSLTDTALYALGKKNPEDLDKIVSGLATGKSYVPKKDTTTYDYNELIGTKLTVASGADKYFYDKKNKIWVDKSGKEKYRKKIAAKGHSITVVGIMQSKDDAASSLLSSGIYYPTSLTDYLIQKSANSKVVKEQKKHPKINIFTGRKFGSQSSAKDLAPSDFFTFDQTALGKAFKLNLDNMDALNNLMKDMDFSTMDFSSLIDTKDLASILSQDDLNRIVQAAASGVSEKDLQNMFRALLSGYVDYARDDLPSADDVQKSLSKYLTSDEAQKIVRDFMKDIFTSSSDQIQNGDFNNLKISQEQWQKFADDLISGYMSGPGQELIQTDRIQKSFTKYLKTKKAQKIIGSATDSLKNNKQLQREISRLETKAQKKIGSKLSAAMQKAAAKAQIAIMNNLMSSLSSNGMDSSNLLQIDKEAFVRAFRVNLSDDELKNLASSLLGSNSESYDDNMEALGYAEKDRPSDIKIYPNSYESKLKIEDLIAKYNNQKKAEGKDDQVISYNDLAGGMLSSVTDIVNTVSKVMIALVAVSLIVSSIMIGVITHISVIERRKEIGILRAMGASKSNIANVFNAETLITGLFAGGIGVGVAWALTFPINYAIHHLIGQADVTAVLEPAAAVALVLLSVVLNVGSGLVPALKAARSDPVTALRGE